MLGDELGSVGDGVVSLRRWLHTRKRNYVSSAVPRCAARAAAHMKGRGQGRVGWSEEKRVANWSAR
eukprot:COSAG05_NODE_75_length_21588_cov_303.091438_14_plen_66_part_00